MSKRSFLLRRLAGTAVSVWVVFTLAFAYVRATSGLAGAVSVGGGPASPSDSLLAQYVDWLVWFATIWDAPVAAPILESLPYTLAYLVPGLAFAVVAGIGVRIYTVASEGNRLERLTDGFTLLAVSVPTFLLAYFLRWWLLPHYFSLLNDVRIYDPLLGPLSLRNLQATVWPASVMGLYLFAVQLHYSGEELREYLSAEFVKTARAKGAGVWRVGRHVFRNAAIPLLTLFFTDMLGMVVVGVFVVEFVTHVPGVGELAMDAVLDRNLKLVFSLALLSVLAGVFTNFLQDVAYALFDPRVDFGE
ncbi:ABC transporter permease subunit [Halorussus sp. AFM4]|uniref:ABC transporter permease subunit n=1 Tax=Halorussus sp. AFM4 TaxID=3421651 RepID=UPI003EBA2599